MLSINDYYLGERRPPSHTLTDDNHVSYEKSYAERIMKLCLPIQMHICFAPRLQKLLFILMKIMSADMALKADVMIHLLNFLEQLDIDSNLWICCCESGFAFTFLQHLLPIVEEENKEAVGAFIKHKINELYSNLVQNEDEYANKVRFLLLQELLHVVANSASFQWTSHAYEIILAANGVLSLFVPFSSQESATIANKCLLVCSTVLEQLLQGTILDDTLAAFQVVVDMCNKSAQLVINTEEKENASTLNKSALLVLSRASIAVPQSKSYLSNYIAKFMDQSFSLQTRIALKTYLLRIECSNSSTNNESIETSVNDMVALKELQDILNIYYTESRKQSNLITQEDVVCISIGRFCKEVLEIDMNPTSALTLLGEENDNTERSKVTTLQVIHDFWLCLIQIVYQDYLISQEKSMCYVLLIGSLEDVIYSFSNSGSSTAQSPKCSIDTMLSILHLITLFLKYTANEMNSPNIVSLTLVHFIEEKINEILTVCNNSTILSTSISTLLFIYDTHYGNNSSTKLNSFIKHSMRCIQSFFKELVDITVKAKVYNGNQVDNIMNMINGYLAGLNNTLDTITSKYNDVYTSVLGYYDEIVEIFIDLVQFYLSTTMHTLLKDNSILATHLLFSLTNTLYIISTLQTKLALNYTNETQSSNNKLSSNASTYSLWVHLLLLSLHHRQCKTDHMDNSFIWLLDQLEGHISLLAGYTLPLLYTSYHSLSTTNVINEVMVSNICLQEYLRQIQSKFKHINKALYAYSDFSSSGLVWYEVYYYTTLKYMEEKHVQSTLDIRYMVSYLREADAIVNKAQSKAIIKICGHVQKRWIESIERYFKHFIPSAPNSTFILSLSDLPALSPAHPKVNILPIYWEREKVKTLLLAQAQYLLVHCVDQLKSVRAYSTESLYLLFKSQYWLVTNPSTASVLASVMLDNIERVEEEVREMITGEIRERRFRQNPYSILDSQDVESSSLPLAPPSPSTPSQSYSHLISSYPPSLPTPPSPTFSYFLSLSASLSAPIYPQQLDVLYMISYEYFLFSYTLLSIYLPPNTKLQCLESYLSQHSSSIAADLAREMMSSTIPTFHLSPHTNPLASPSLSSLPLLPDGLPLGGVEKARERAAHEVHRDYVAIKRVTPLPPVEQHSTPIREREYRGGEGRGQGSEEFQRESRGEGRYLGGMEGVEEVEELLQLITNTSYFLHSIHYTQLTYPLEDVKQHLLTLLHYLLRLFKSTNISTVCYKMPSILHNYYTILDKLLVYYITHDSIVNTIVHSIESLYTYSKTMSAYVHCYTLHLTTNSLMYAFSKGSAGSLAPLIKVVKEQIENEREGYTAEAVLTMLSPLFSALPSALPSLRSREERVVVLYLLLLGVRLVSTHSNNREGERESVRIVREQIYSLLFYYILSLSSPQSSPHSLHTAHDKNVLVEEISLLSHLIEELMKDAHNYPLHYTPPFSLPSPASSLLPLSPALSTPSAPLLPFVCFGAEASLLYYSSLTHFKHIYSKSSSSSPLYASPLYASDLSLLLSPTSSFPAYLSPNRLIDKDSNKLLNALSYTIQCNLDTLSSSHLDNTLSTLRTQFTTLIHKLHKHHTTDIQYLHTMYMISPRLTMQYFTSHMMNHHNSTEKKTAEEMCLYTMRLIQSSKTLFDGRVVKDVHMVDVLYQCVTNPSVSKENKLECLAYLKYVHNKPLEKVLLFFARYALLHSHSKEDVDLHMNISFVQYVERILYRYSLQDTETIVFFLPQLVQLLRRDCCNILYDYLLTLAISHLNICYHLLFILLIEGHSSQTAHENQNAKYGFCHQLHGADPLPALCLNLHKDILQRLPRRVLIYLTQQLDYFHTLTNVSNDLMSIKNKELHREYIHNALKDVSIPNALFLPTNIYRKVVSVEIQHGKAMQSAAKCPYLLLFNTTNWSGPEDYVLHISNNNDLYSKQQEILPTTTSNSNGVDLNDINGGILPTVQTEPAVQETPMPERVVVKNRSKGIGRRVTNEHDTNPVAFKTPKKIGATHNEAVSHADQNNSKSVIQRKEEGIKKEGCIFKVNDDCRQDMLTIQVMRLMVNCFKAAHIDVYMAPYSVMCIRVGEKRLLGGIIEVVSGVHSRDQLGKAGYKTLLQYFVTQYGQAGSEGFLQAQMNFAKSLAGYSILCYLLHIKDRHNGNILFDKVGHIIHIDFGFILGISPGGNLGFETAPFKISKEMVDLLGGNKSEVFKYYTSLTVQAYLAVRATQEQILAVIVSYADADLPCFQYREDVLIHLKERFVSDLTVSQAAKHMEGLIQKAVHDWTGAAYDGVQKLQNNIYSPEWK